MLNIQKEGLSESQNTLNQQLNSLKYSKSLLINDLIINDNSCKEISKFILENDILTNIEGKNGYVTSKGLAILADSISKSSKLEKISFSKNQIDDEFFVKFCNALSLNKSIKEVDLSNNILGYTSSIHIAELLKRNSSIQIFDLQNNFLKNEGCNIIIEAIKNNYSIQELKLEGNGAEESILNFLKILLSRNGNVNYQKYSLEASLLDKKLEPKITSMSQYPQLSKNSQLIESAQSSQKPITLPSNSNHSEINSLPISQPEINAKISHANEIKKKEKTRKSTDKSIQLHKDIEQTDYSKHIQKSVEINLKLMEDQKEKYEEEIEKLKNMLNAQKERMQIEKTQEIQEFQKTLISDKKAFEENIKNLYQSKYENDNKTITQKQVEMSHILKGYQEKCNSFEETNIELNKEIRIQNENNMRIIKGLEEKYNEENRCREKLSVELNRQISKYKIKKKIMKSEILKLGNEVNLLQENQREVELKLSKKEQEIISLKCQQDKDITILNEQTMRMNVESKEKINEYNQKVQQMEFDLNKCKKENQYQIKLLVEEMNKKLSETENHYKENIKTIEEKYSMLKEKNEYLDKENEKLIQKITEEKLKNEVIEKTPKKDLKVEKEQSDVIKEWEKKSQELEYERQQITNKNLNLIDEIKKLKMDINQMNAYKEERNALREDNISLNNSIEKFKLHLEKVDKINQKNEQIISKYEKKMNELVNENQRLKQEMSEPNSSSELQQLKASLQEAKLQITDLKEKALFFRNKYIEERAIGDSLQNDLEVMQSQKSKNRNQIQEKQFISTFPKPQGGEKRKKYENRPY